MLPAFVPPSAAESKSLSLTLVRGPARVLRAIHSFDVCIACAAHLAE
jgi:Ni,Fe-hydrogenase I large subunit